MIFATSTERAVGLVILAVVVIGGLAYFVFNQLSGKKEVGSEIELAPNRKPYYPDEVLETSKLERTQTLALVTLGIIGITLPAYWLGEPARQEGAIEDFDNIFTSRGTGLYEQYCSSCHGPTGGGGVTSYTITDDAGEFVAQVSWNVPALTTVLSRFSEDEVRHILNYGRGVMPAWGAPGGGALTSQQVDELVYFLRTIQLTDEAEIQDEVLSGIAEQARAYVLEEDPDLAEALADAEGDEEATAAATEAIDAAVADLLERITATDASDEDQILYGELLFSNPAGAGQYNCARCHTPGWSYGARSGEAVEELVAEWPLLAENGILTDYRPGAGAFGPSLWTVESSYPSIEGHIDFVTVGGGFGPNDSNQMPGFGGREDENLLGEDGEALRYPALLTQEQIAAIVAYERSLGE